MEEKFYLINTYGCQMNIHESEKLAGMLEKLGYKATQDSHIADVVVFNTCAIRESAEQKIYGNIGDLKGIKKQRPDMIIAVCGCMSQQKGVAENIKKRYPFVDIVFGTHNLHMFEEYLQNANDSCYDDFNYSLPSYTRNGINETVHEIRGDDVKKITDRGRFTNHYDTVNLNSIFGVYVNTLKRYGAKYLKIVMNIDVREIDDGYRHIFLYNGDSENSNEIAVAQKFEYGVGKVMTAWKTFTFEFCINLDNVIGETFYIRYGASGKNNDDWENKNVNLKFGFYDAQPTLGTK